MGSEQSEDKDIFGDPKTTKTNRTKIKTVTKLLQEGRSFLLEKDYKKTISKFRQVHELDENNYYAYYGLGMCYKEMKKFDECVECLTKGVKYYLKSKDDSKKESLYINMLYNRGNVYIIIKEYLMAVQDFNLVILLKRENFPALLNRGLAHFLQEDYDESIADFTEALRLNPNSITALNNRGKSYFYMKSYHKSVKDCSKAVEINKNDWRAFYNRALAFQALKEYEKGIKDLQSVLKLKISKKLGEKINQLLKEVKGSLKEKQDNDQKIIQDMKRIETNDEEFFENLECKICYENKRSIAFNCGHCVCGECATIMKTCPFCAKVIKSKIKLFF